jgi:hypothetical protein
VERLTAPNLVRLPWLSKKHDIKGETVKLNLLRTRKEFTTFMVVKFFHPNVIFVNDASDKLCLTMASLLSLV